MLLIKKKSFEFLRQAPTILNEIVYIFCNSCLLEFSQNLRKLVFLNRTESHNCKELSAVRDSAKEQNTSLKILILCCSVEYYSQNCTQI